jgi:hypothetical protein
VTRYPISISLLLKTLNRLAKFVAVSALLPLPSVMGQIPTATLGGTVHDKSGAVIAHAAVELRNADNGATRKVTTNASGIFSFAALSNGAYDITVNAPGFSQYKLTGYHLDPGDNRALNQIELGASSTESVTIVADSQRIDNTSGETSSLITASDIEHLAVEGRDVTELFKILPGFAIALPQSISNVQYDPEQVSSALGNYSANGTPISGVTMKWDGANITDPGDQTGALQNVNYDMVSEVKVQVANFAADESNGPVVVNAVTKAGGKQFHGAAYIYARTTQLNSTDWLAGFLGYGKPDDRYIYPGFNIGGPILIPGTQFNHNKRVTFFVGGEDYAQRDVYAYGSAGSAIAHALVPTQAMRQGDFSASSLQAYLGSSYGSNSYANISGVPTVDPNGLPLTNGNIAASIDPGGIGLINMLPLPNRASNGSYNWIQQNLIDSDLWQMVARVDADISQRYKLFVRYSIEPGLTGVPQVAFYSPASVMGSVNTPGGGLVNPSKSQSAVADLTMVLSPSLTNEVFGSYAYSKSQFQAKTQSALEKSAYGYPYDGAYSANGSKQMPQLQDYAYDGLPLDLINDFSFGPLYLKKFLAEAGDNVTKVLRRHVLKAGVYVEQITSNQRLINSNTPTNGALTQYYNGPVITDLDGSTVYSSGNYLANAMEGIFSSYTQSNIEPNYDVAFWNVDGYVTDTWKVRDNITVNGGLRVEHIGAWYDKHGIGIAVFNPSTLNQTVSAAYPLPGFTWHSIDPAVPNSGITAKPAFYEPRAGFAWDIASNGKTVMRGGYGQYRYHDPSIAPEAALASSDGVFTTTITGNGGLTLRAIGEQNLPQTGGTASTNAYGLDRNDNQQAVTQTYSLAIDRVLPYKTQIEIAYIGSATNHLINNGSQEPIGLSNVNALAYGGLFAPVNGVRPTPFQVANMDSGQVNAYLPYGTTPYDPKTGMLTTSPYGSVNNYGAISVPEHNAYSNYNGIQVSVNRQAGPFRYGVNYTFGKALGILGAYDGGSPVDSTNLAANYGVTTFDRSHIFNANYSYSFGAPVKNKWLGGFVNRWEVSGITQIQSGQNLQVAIGQPNFSTIVQLTDAAYTGGSTPFVNASSETLLGTPDINVMPSLICNPRSGLGPHQYINGNCFALNGATAAGPIVNGPAFYPYMHGPVYFDSDLNAQKAFKLGPARELQFRLSAFNFLNHPLYSFNSARSNEYQSLIIAGATPGDAVAQPEDGSTAPGSEFGTVTLKQGRRVLEVSMKFVF